jgi:hypothetical protein
MMKPRKYTTNTIAALALGLMAIALPAVAQDSYGVEYAKTKGGGLLLNNMELKQSPADGKNSKRDSVGMNGYGLIFQSDSNVCLKKSDPASGDYTLSDYRWCVNDEPTMKTAYRNTRKVMFANGMLQCLDAAGKVIWSSTPKKDPFAKIIIAPNGQLMITNAGGAVYWSKGGR